MIASRVCVCVCTSGEGVYGGRSEELGVVRMETEREEITEDTEGERVCVRACCV